jgi:hypothetical protein
LQARTGQQIARLRAESKRAMAERDRLGAQVQELGQLVEACRAELVRRGWQERGEGAPLTYRSRDGLAVIRTGA